MKVLLLFVLVSALTIIDVVLPLDYDKDGVIKVIDYDRNQAMVKLNIVRYGTCEVCSGSFIDPKWILTSAHCVHDAESLTADVGLHVNSSCAMTYTLRTSDIIVHPSFTTQYDHLGHISKRSHDIALIKFNEETSCERIWLALLPKDNVRRNSFFKRFVELKRFESSCNTTSPSLANMRSNLWVTASRSCSSEYENSVDPMDERIDQEQLCIYRPNNETLCGGDSSGHIFKVHFPTLVGIMTDAPKICSKGDNIIFTAVGCYVTWIKSHIPHLRTELSRYYD